MTYSGRLGGEEALGCVGSGLGVGHEPEPKACTSRGSDPIMSGPF